MIGFSLTEKQVVPDGGGLIWSWTDDRRGQGKSFAGAFAMANRLVNGMDIDLVGPTPYFVRDQMLREILRIVGPGSGAMRWVARDYLRFSNPAMGKVVIWHPGDRYIPRDRHDLGGAWFDDVIPPGRTDDRVWRWTGELLGAMTRWRADRYSKIVLTGEVPYPTPFR